MRKVSGKIHSDNLHGESEWSMSPNLKCTLKNSKTQGEVRSVRRKRNVKAPCYVSDDSASDNEQVISKRFISPKLKKSKTQGKLFSFTEKRKRITNSDNDSDYVICSDDSENGSVSDFDSHPCATSTPKTILKYQKGSKNIKGKNKSSKVIVQPVDKGTSAASQTFTLTTPSSGSQSGDSSPIIGEVAAGTGGTNGSGPSTSILAIDATGTTNSGSQAVQISIDESCATSIPKTVLKYKKGSTNTKGKNKSSKVIIKAVDKGISAASQAFTLTTPSSGSQPGDSSPITDEVAAGTSGTNSSAPSTSIVAADTSGTTNSGSQAVEISIDESLTPVQQKKGRIRTRNPQQWFCNMRKTKRNQGLAYQTMVKATKVIKTVEKRKVGPPCTCQGQCFNKVGDIGITTIFNEHWALGNYNLQTANLQSKIIRNLPKRQRKMPAESRKIWSYTYSVTYMNIKFIICHNAFISIHGITPGRVRLARDKVNVGGSAQLDRRGLNPNPRKISDEALKCVHEHIQLLPVCTSHYSRTKNPNRQYLEAHNKISKLHKLYKTWMLTHHKDVLIVTQKYYNNIFSLHYNIGFKPTEKDTCDTCTQIRKCISDGKDAGKADIVTLYESKMEEHLEKVDNASSALKNAKNPDSDWVFVCMDLQQTLPCPRLSVGSAYYKRKIWLYNFCVHDISDGETGESYMYVWEENVAARGSVEIASCLIKWLGDYVLNKPQHPRNLRIFADNCGGQNKNILMTLTIFLKSICSTLIELSCATLWLATHTWRVTVHLVL